MSDIKYRGIAPTLEEAEQMAERLLGDYASTIGVEKRVFTSLRSEDEDGEERELVLLLGHGEEEITREEIERGERTPIVYAQRRYKETPASEGTYWLYLLFDKDRLPFFFKYTDSLRIALPFLRPTIKPEKPLAVEALLTLQGTEELEDALEGGYAKERPHFLRAYVQRAKDAPKELRLYAFFDNFGDGTLTDVKEALEAGEYDGGAVGGDVILNALTGKTYKTEASFLKALASFAGKEAVDKHKDELIEGYRLDKALRFVDFLYYELLRTEDYASVEAHYKEYASAVGYKEEYTELLHKREAKPEEKGSAMELALYKYLSAFWDLRIVYEGLSEKRIQEYLNVPASTFRRVQTIVREKALL